MWCTRLAENTGHKKGCKNWPFVHHCTTLSGYIFATKARIDNREKTCNSNISSTCPHIGFVSLFVTAATSVNKVKQTLHDVWPSPWLVYCIYILGGFCPLMEFCSCKSQFTSKSCILLFWQLYGTARHGTRNGILELSLLIIFNIGHHLYTEGGPPSRWA